MAYYLFIWYVSIPRRWWTGSSKLLATMRAGNICLSPQHERYFCALIRPVEQVVSDLWSMPSMFPFYSAPDVSTVEYKNLRKIQVKLSPRPDPSTSTITHSTVLDSEPVTTVPGTPTAHTCPFPSLFISHILYPHSLFKNSVIVAMLPVTLVLLASNFLAGALVSAAPFTLDTRKLHTVSIDNIAPYNNTNNSTDFHSKFRLKPVVEGYVLRGPPPVRRCDDTLCRGYSTPPGETMERLP
ncbi:hypothetical protein OF83DRAFT_308538 [Amylostereum chailletii]|nr:hypothetical protein OF83DRAFT_308538 [Amylostereum chailletii]